MPETTLGTVRRFHNAFDRHDLDAVMALMTADGVFGDIFPHPYPEICTTAGNALVSATE
jgi:ketosteroid isomerase-like protein